jgi:hypothetical protein
MGILNYFAIFIILNFFCEDFSEIQRFITKKLHRAQVLLGVYSKRIRMIYLRSMFHLYYIIAQI